MVLPTRVGTAKMLRLFQRMKRGYPLLLLGRRGLLPRCWGVQLHDLADLLALRAAGRYHLSLLLLLLTHREHRTFTALHNPRCRWGLNPPVSSRLRAM